MKLYPPSFWKKKNKDGGYYMEVIMKIKVNNKMLERFLNIMDEYGEFVFGDNKEIKQQLEVCLNSQGYWSGCAIRVFYDTEAKDFYIENRW